MSYNKYNQAIQNINPISQVITLYEGVVKNLKKIQESSKKQDYESCYNTLIKTKAIINGLQLSIDHKNGGDVANSLDAFYDQVSFKLSKINLNSLETEKSLNEIISDIIQMRDAWINVEKELSCRNEN